MAKSRKKKVVITEKIGRLEAEEIFAEYADLDNRMDSLTAAIDREMIALRDKHQPKISDLQDKRQLAFLKLEHFAETHPEYFTKRKTMRFIHGKLGFRTGMPQLKTQPGVTWKTVLKSLEKGFPKFVKKNPSVDKEQLLIKRKDNKVKLLFAAVGIVVVQDNTFFVEPKKEEV